MMHQCTDVQGIWQVRIIFQKLITKLSRGPAMPVAPLISDCGDGLMLSSVLCRCCLI
jgi:hypothetical protein